VPVHCGYCRSDFLRGHIPGARFLDIEAVSDKSKAAPHMLPSAEQFREAAEVMGVGHDDHLVVYDNDRRRTAARGWFMFRHFGASHVAILDGGFEQWLRDGRPTQTGEPARRQSRFDARERADDVIAKERILAGLELPLVDARPRERFDGCEPDPRPNVAAGHIPGSLNLPFLALYDDAGMIKSTEEIRRIFAATGIDPTRPFVASCGSGVTANSLIFAAWLLGNRKVQLYDGSWSEWGADPRTPKSRGRLRP
jgi:thiosulfate/3-mercaptopyruvate sulfurtransferase